MASTGSAGSNVWWMYSLTDCTVRDCGAVVKHGAARILGTEGGLTVLVAHDVDLDGLDLVGGDFEVGNHFPISRHFGSRGRRLERFGARSGACHGTEKHFYSPTYDFYGHNMDG